jgi:hypothetical protein
MVVRWFLQGEKNNLKNQQVTKYFDQMFSILTNFLNLKIMTGTQIEYDKYMDILQLLRSVFYVENCWAHEILTQWCGKMLV